MNKNERKSIIRKRGGGRRGKEGEIEIKEVIEEKREEEEEEVEEEEVEE